jgi:hypothetical protein
MLIAADYMYLRPRMRAGDVVAFSGSGFISDAIKLLTDAAVSHVGIIYWTNDERCDLMESTTLSGVKGVQQTHFSERLVAYNGPIWCLPLSHCARAKLDQKAFFDCLTSQKGKPYDYGQVLHFAWDLLHLFAQGEDSSRLFCSELAALALKTGRVLPSNLDSSEVRPVDLCRFRIYDRDYFQLKGKATEIKGFNSLYPERFKNG